MRISDWSSDVCSSDLSRLNRGVSAIAVLVWPLAVFSWQRGLRWLALALPPAVLGLTLGSQSSASMVALGAGLLAAAPAGLASSEERRVGKECVRTCRSRWSPSH